VRLTTDGSDFDTLLAVYMGPSFSALSLVASNDDHGSVNTSRVRFEVTEGVEYHIAVDGFNDGSTVEAGRISLQLTLRSGPIVRPLNDNFTNRHRLAGASAEDQGSNVDATREAGEPSHDEKLGDTSVWWSWVAPFAGLAMVTTTGSTFDTLLAVYVGSSLTTLKLVAGNDDENSETGVLTSVVVFEAVAGVEYQIAVDGFDGATGQVVLRVAPVEFRLSVPVKLPDGSMQVGLIAAPGKTYEIQASVDFKEWVSIAVLAHRGAVAHFPDSAARTQARRFYRAMLRP
jgi:hypothetical protein